ncbi:MAG: PAS domain S-box protein [Akkermansiaceae bacterium]|nr:PAS domain S-box protein [Verrucomicrobiales bacterium]
MMHPDDNEEKLLRSVALQNARAILLARERVERELIQAKEALEHKSSELAAQRESYRVTLSSIGDAVITCDTGARITFLNPVAEAMTGWKSSEVVGQPLETVFRIINEETRQPADSPVEKVLREGAVVGLANHTALISRDGRETAIDDSAAPILDASGKICGVVMVFHDITHQKRAAEALRESAERLHAIFHQAAVGIAMATLEGHFVEANSKCLDILGYSSEELRQLTFTDITYREDLEPTHSGISRLLAGEIADLVYEKRYVRKDGALVWSLTTVTLLRNAAGQPERFIGVIEDITRRKGAESERERLTGILERSVNEIYIFSPETLRFEYVNEGARRNLGYTLDEMRGKTPLDIKPEYTEQSFREMVAPLLRGEKEKHVFSTIHRRANGTDYPVEVHLQAVAHAGQRVFLAVILDVTERQEAEERLRRSEEELRALANSIPQLAWMADPDGNIFWYNQRWYDYTGATFEQMAGWGWQSVHDPQMLPLVLERWKESIRTGQAFDMEFPLRGADGVFRWFLTRVNPVRDHAGRVVRWFGTNTNVDDFRRVQEALREESRMLELLNNTGTAIASNLDRESIVQTVTNSATQITGAKFGAFFYNVINHEGESFLRYTLSGAPREALEQFDLPRHPLVFNATFQGKEVIRSGDITRDARYDPSNGQWPVRSYLAVPVISRSGEAMGGLFFGHPQPDVFSERAERLALGVAAQAAVAMDNARLYDAAQKEIAERKRAEQALRESESKLAHSNADLDSKVRQRTASLEDAIAQMEEFSYSVSHDLRGPLRAMSAYARALIEDCGAQLDSTARDYVERILRSSDRMEKLTHDVLTYSRLARSELPLISIDLGKLVRELISQYAEFQPPVSQIEFEGPSIRALAHESSMGQCITNLLSNAVKFVHPGTTPVVRVRAEFRGDNVRLWIEDNGIGIKPEYQERLFKMFERLHRHEHYQGTGIGLAIVRKAMEKMGGTVGVSSDGVKGSRFWLELPKA